MMNKNVVYIVNIFDGMQGDSWNQAVFYSEEEAEKYLDLTGYVRGRGGDDGDRFDKPIYGDSFVKPIYDNDLGLDAELYAEIERWEVR